MMFNKINALSTPWVESPFFYDILDTLDITDDQKSLATKFHEDGYIILDLNLNESTIESIVKEMYDSLKRENIKLQAEYYTYSNSPRLFEEWKTSENIRNLCLNKKIIETLEFLYGRETFPFSTINFFIGSNQPLHSDTIHFHTQPELWMSGVWVALEDTNAYNGTLNIVPGSHKWPIYDYNSLNLPHPDEQNGGNESNYRIYEDFIRELVKSKKTEVKPIPLKKGQCLIWAANLLHGGSPLKNPNTNVTRLTQAIHYFYKGCNKYYSPMYSRINQGLYAEKWCNESNNIKTLFNNL